MGKNDAFKSFLKPLFFCLGTFVSFFLFTNTTLAAWSPADYRETITVGLRNSEETTSIGVSNAETPTGSHYIYLNLALASTGPSLAKIRFTCSGCGGGLPDAGGQTISSYNRAWYQFSWTQAATYSITNIYLVDTDSPYTDFYVYGTYGAPAYYIDQLPPELINTDPTISVTKPESAEQTITIPNYEYIWSATKYASTDATIISEIFPYDGATLSDYAQISLMDTFTGTATTATGSISDNYLLGNNDFMLKFTIYDNETGKTAVATRNFTINIPDNINGNGTITAETSTIASYCNARGKGSGSWFCNFIGSFETALMENPPMSYIKSFKTGFLGMNASNSVGYSVIPAFIDDFFEWLWYILFVLIIFRYSNKLFKA